MGSEFIVRPARPEDVGAIYDLILGLADYEKLSHEATGTREDLEQWLFGERVAAEVLVGCLGDDVVGFALFFTSFSTFLCRPGIYLEDLYVRPEYRGRGFGRELIGALANFADERGCGRLEWSVLDWNEPAIRFYESLGARPNEGWTVYRVTRDGFGKVMGIDYEKTPES